MKEKHFAFILGYVALEGSRDYSISIPLPDDVISRLSVPHGLMEEVVLDVLARSMEALEAMVVMMREHSEHAVWFSLGDKEGLPPT